MNHADYRKFNDRTCNSSTYHKKDDTNIRAKLKVISKNEINECLFPPDPCDDSRPLVNKDQ